MMNLWNWTYLWTNTKIIWILKKNWFSRVRETVLKITIKIKIKCNNQEKIIYNIFLFKKSLTYHHLNIILIFILNYINYHKMNKNQSIINLYNIWITKYNTLNSMILQKRNNKWIIQWHLYFLKKKLLLILQLDVNFLRYFYEFDTIIVYINFIAFCKFI